MSPKQRTIFRMTLILAIFFLVGWYWSQGYARMVMPYLPNLNPLSPPRTTAVIPTAVFTPTQQQAVTGETSASDKPTTAPTRSASAALPLPPEDSVSKRLSVPEGFAIREFTSGLERPRLMTVGPDGALYVAERSGGRVTRLPDDDGDGRADGNETVLENLYRPHSLEWYEGCLYVAEDDQISRHCDDNNDGIFEQHEEIVSLPSGGGHSSRTLHFGPDGKMYVSAGSTCNVCIEDDPRRATIMRFNVNGTIPDDNPFADADDTLRRPLWAEGLRNSIDFLFLPDGQLWANHNGRDQMINNEIKNDKPLEEAIIAVEKGEHYGWPFCTSEHPDGSLAPGPGPYEPVADPSDDVPDMPEGFSCDETIPALYTVLAHSAPIGMTRYDHSHFPDDYHGDIFEALHGSWNRTPPAPCKVVQIEVEDQMPTAQADFVTGFQDNPVQPCNRAWGRPAGVIVGADGALYVSDDWNGRVYRVVWVEKTQ